MILINIFLQDQSGYSVPSIGIHAEAILPILLDAGADVNAVAGASVNAQDIDGYTALITAAVNDKPRLAQLMLSLGSGPNARSNDGMTALAWARQLGHREIEYILLQAGARQ